MRRKANRIFRYLFPTSIISFGFILFIQELFEKKTEIPQIEQQNITAISSKVQAKVLRMVSHNPETQAQLAVNADNAFQSGDKITLNNPVGIFDNPEGKTSLCSKQAAYYESNREVHFFEKVKFNHFSGFNASTSHAVLDTKTQDIFGNQGIKASHQKNTISAHSYKIHTNRDTINFKGGVCLNISRKQR